MAILAECPFCHGKQSVKNRLCSCGEDLIQPKRSKKVKYWISYRLRSGRQRREAVGNSIEEARDAESDLLKAVDQIETYLESVDQNVDQPPLQKKKEASQDQLTP